MTISALASGACTSAGAGSPYEHHQVFRNRDEAFAWAGVSDEQMFEAMTALEPILH